MPAAGVTFFASPKKVTKKRRPISFVHPARFGKLSSFRSDIHVASSLKRTSCAFYGNFPPMLGELTWESKSKKQKINQRYPTIPHQKLMQRKVRCLRQRRAHRRRDCAECTNATWSQ